jgi:23S rRNA (uracil1939-C5)-methyltransferase
MEFSVSARGGDPPTIGLHASDPDAPLVDVAACAVQSETANAVLAAVRTMLAALPVVADGECPVERVVLRRSEADGRVTVALGLTGPGDAGIEPAVRELYERNRDSIRGVVRFHHPRGRRGGTKARLLAGDGRLTERVAGFRFDLPPTSFFQVNTSAAETVLRTVLEMASPVAGGHVLDLYGGLGLYALGLVREGAPSAVVCDADLDAVRCGRRTAARHRFGQLRYVHADVRRFLADAGRGEKPRTVVANPPRTGFGRGVADGLRALRPERLIVVSCDPPTLARDLAALGSDGLYEIERIVPLDLFPQTPHVEVVVALRLRGAVRPPRPRGSSRPRGSGSRSR